MSLLPAHRAKNFFQRVNETIHLVHGTRRHPDVAGRKWQSEVGADQNIAITELPHQVLLLLAKVDQDEIRVASNAAQSHFRKLRQQKRFPLLDLSRIIPHQLLMVE